MGIISYHDPEVLKASHRLLEEYQFLDVLKEWVDQTEQKEIWVGTPTALHNQISGVLRDSMREYNAQRVARCLASLVRREVVGVADLGNQYRLDPVAIMKNDS